MGCNPQNEKGKKGSCHGGGFESGKAEHASAKKGVESLSGKRKQRGQTRTKNHRLRVELILGEQGENRMIKMDRERVGLNFGGGEEGQRMRNMEKIVSRCGVGVVLSRGGNELGGKRSSLQKKKRGYRTQEGDGETCSI